MNDRVGASDSNLEVRVPSINQNVCFLSPVLHRFHMNIGNCPVSAFSWLTKLTQNSLRYLRKAPFALVLSFHASKKSKHAISFIFSINWCQSWVPCKDPICQTSEKPKTVANIWKTALLGQISDIIQKVELRSYLYRSPKRCCIAWNQRDRRSRINVLSCCQEKVIFCMKVRAA